MTAISAQVSPNFKVEQKHKLIINSIINPLTVIHDCRNGELLENKYRCTIQNLLDEANDVLKPNLKIGNVLRVLNMTKDNYSSLLQDCRFGKQTKYGWYCEPFLGQPGYNSLNQIYTMKRNDYEK